MSNQSRAEYLTPKATTGRGHLLHWSARLRKENTKTDTSCLVFPVVLLSSCVIKKAQMAGTARYLGMDRGQDAASLQLGKRD